jgi:hypothetical protein
VSKARFDGVAFAWATEALRQTVGPRAVESGTLTISDAAVSAPLTGSCVVRYISADQWRADALLSMDGVDCLLALFYHPSVQSRPGWCLVRPGAPRFEAVRLSRREAERIWRALTHINSVRCAPGPRVMPDEPTDTDLPYYPPYELSIVLSDIADESRPLASFFEAKVMASAAAYIIRTVTVDKRAALVREPVWAFEAAIKAEHALLDRIHENFAMVASDRRIRRDLFRETRRQEAREKFKSLLRRLPFLSGRFAKDWHGGPVEVEEHFVEEVLPECGEDRLDALLAAIFQGDEDLAPWDNGFLTRIAGDYLLTHFPQEAKRILFENLPKGEMKKKDDSTLHFYTAESADVLWMWLDRFSGDVSLADAILAGARDDRDVVQEALYVKYVSAGDATSLERLEEYVLADDPRLSAKAADLLRSVCVDTGSEDLLSWLRTAYDECVWPNTKGVILAALLEVGRGEDLAFAIKALEDSDFRRQLCNVYQKHARAMDAPLGIDRLLGFDWTSQTGEARRRFTPFLFELVKARPFLDRDMVTLLGVAGGEGALQFLTEQQRYQEQHPIDDGFDQDCEMTRIDQAIDLVRLEAADDALAYLLERSDNTSLCLPGVAWCWSSERRYRRAVTAALRRSCTEEQLQALLANSKARHLWVYVFEALEENRGRSTYDAEAIPRRFTGRLPIW